MRRVVTTALVALAACDDHPTSIATPADAAVDGAVDAPVDAAPVLGWSKIATVDVTLDLGNDRGFVAASQGSKIYLAAVTEGTPPDLRAFDVDTLQLSGLLAVPPGAQTDFDASGFGAIFVGDATSLYLIGDEAQRYDPAANTWSPIAGYSRTVYMRGEANGAWHGQSNSVYLLGGRDWDTNQDQASAVRLTGGAWATEPGDLPYAVSNGAAYALPADDRLFVAAGRTGDNNRRHVLVHTVGTTTWTSLPDAPSDLGNVTGMGHVTSGGATRVFVATPQHVELLDPQAMTWDRTLAAPGASTDHQRVVMVGGTPYAVVRRGASADVFELTSID